MTGGPPRLVVCAVAAAVLLVTGCELPRGEPALDAAILIPVTATNVRKLEVYDGKVMYEIPEAYPGRRFIDTVHASLEQQGWKRRETDFMDAQKTLPTSVKWEDVVADGRRQTTWSEQWQNARGHIAWYTFKYLSAARTRGAPGGPMYVEITYLRPETAKTLAVAGGAAGR